MKHSKKNARTKLQQTVDQEILSKGKDIVNDFDEAEALYVPAKKRANKLISIRLPMDMIKNLHQIAERKQVIGYQQLIKNYLSEAILLEQSRFESKQPSVNVISTTLKEINYHSGSFRSYHMIELDKGWYSDVRNEVTKEFEEIVNASGDKQHGN